MFNVIKKIINLIFKKYRQFMFNKAQLEKEINVLSVELSNAHILLLGIDTIIEQSNVNFEIYSEFYDFFYLVYYSFYDQLYHCISRLYDNSRGSLSIVTILERHKAIFNDELSKRELDILQQINDSETKKKIKTIRDRLGRAHLDRKVALNPEKQSKLYEETMHDLNDIAKYIKLLTEALDLLSDRLDIPIRHCRPNTSIKREINSIFNRLQQAKSDN